jgi:chromosome partitioning related protein ParA
MGHGHRFKEIFMATVVISLVSTKGVVGKTTVAANLAGLTAALGLRTLLIDGDVQPSLSKYYALAEAASTGMAEVISSGGLITTRDISRTQTPNLDIILSNMTDATQNWLKQREDRLILLKRAVRQPVVRDNYEIVIIDTQGATGELQRTAAMAADIMISPIKPDMMNYSEFVSGTLEMLRQLNAMADLSAELRSGGLCLLINSMDRTINSRGVAQSVRNDFRQHPNVRLLDTVVPASTVYPTSRSMNCPVHAFDKPSGNGRSGYEVMHLLLHELLPHLKGMWADGVPPGNQDHKTIEGV